METKELQENIDVAKWYQSEKKHFDMCGKYDYCVFCKADEEDPCAKATQRMEQSKKPKTEIGENGYPINVTVRSFTEKLDGADAEIRKQYDALRKELLSFKGVNHRVSKKCDNYRAGRGNLIAKITLVGKTLRVNLPLDPHDEKYAGRKFPHKDLGNKKTYAEAPFQFKITSGLSLRRCLSLIDEVAFEKALEKKYARKVKTSK